MGLVLILAGDTVATRSLIMSLEVERFEVRRFTNSEGLIGAFTASKQAGVLIDVSAPWSALYPVLRRLRAHGAGRSYRIMLLGVPGAEATDAVLQGLGITEEDVFPEPYDTSRLVERLRSLPKPSGQGGKAAGVPLSSLGFRVQGEFDDGEVAGVISKIASGGGTGQLEIEIQAQLVTFTFKDGKLVAVKVPTGPLSLGPFLVSRGRLKQVHLDTLAKLGAVTLDSLVGNHVLGPHEILEVASQQADVAIRWAVGPTSGRYRWVHGAQARSGGFPLDIKIQRIILDVFKANASFSVPPVLASMKLQPDAESSERLQAWGLLPFELRIVNQLNGERDVQSIVGALSSGNPSRAKDVIGVLRAVEVLFRQEQSSQEEEEIDWDARMPEFQQTLEKMKDADPYDVLGVTPRTGMSDVRTRFFSLSKEYHPDRAYGADSRVCGVMQEIFRRVQDAYDIISDPRKREAYEAQKEIDEGGLDPRAVINAEISFSQGELFLRNKNYAKALEFFEEASELNAHEPLYRIYVGWVTFLVDPSRHVEAARIINGVLEENEHLDKGFYFLGGIFKARHERGRAEAAFKRAIAANPDNFEAKRELRLFEMRRDKKAGTSGAGRKSFFDRFRRS